MKDSNHEGYTGKGGTDEDSTGSGSGLKGRNTGTHPQYDT